MCGWEHAEEERQLSDVRPLLLHRGVGQVGVPAGKGGGAGKSDSGVGQVGRRVRLLKDYICGG